jgi:AAA domain
MLLWINGPFGGGKTATAYELHRRLPGSVVCDPEHVGFGMRRMLPPALRGDFQDLHAWRTAVLDLLRLTLSAAKVPVIVPMTIADTGYFGEIIGSLRADGFEVRHFALVAEPVTIARRLNRRSLGQLKPDSWAFDQLGYCLRQLRQPEFAEHVRTDQLTVAQVADAIAAAAGLELAPSTGGPVHAWLRQTVTSLRHIRWD